MAETTHESTLAVDLSAAGVRTRAMLKQAKEVSDRLDHRGQRALKRAMRARKNSNERRKLLAEVGALGSLAAMIRDDPASIDRGYVMHPDGGKVPITGDVAVKCGSGLVSLGRIA